VARLDPGAETRLPCCVPSGTQAPPAPVRKRLHDPGFQQV